MTNALFTQIATVMFLSYLSPKGRRKDSFWNLIISLISYHDLSCRSQSSNNKEKKKRIKQLRSLLPQNKKFKGRYFKDNIISTGTQAPCLSQYFHMTSFCYHSNMAAPVLMHQHPNTPLSKKKKTKKKNPCHCSISLFGFPQSPPVNFCLYLINYNCTTCSCWHPSQARGTESLQLT